MLVLNTNLYYDQNQQTTNMEDPAGQFSWADQILSQAATNKEKANSFFFNCQTSSCFYVAISLFALVWICIEFEFAINIKRMLIYVFNVLLE